MLKIGPRVVLKTGPSFVFTVFPIFIVFFWACLKTQIVSHCAKIVFLQNGGDVKDEVFEKKIAFFAFVFFMLERERNRKKNKMEKAKKPLKLGTLRWSSQNRK